MRRESSNFCEPPGINEMKCQTKNEKNAHATPSPFSNIAD